MCRLSINLGASTSWNPKGLSRSVMGLLLSLPLSNFTKIHPVAVALLHTGQTDGHEEANSRFQQVTRTRLTNTVRWRHTDSTHAQIEAAVVLLLVNLIVMWVPLVLRRRSRLATAVVVALCGCRAQLGVRVLLRCGAATLWRLRHAVARRILAARPSWVAVPALRQILPYLFH